MAAQRGHSHYRQFHFNQHSVEDLYGDMQLIAGYQASSVPGQTPITPTAALSDVAVRFPGELHRQGAHGGYSHSRHSKSGMQRMSSHRAHLEGGAEDTEGKGPGNSPHAGRTPHAYFLDKKNKGNTKAVENMLAEVSDSAGLKDTKKPSSWAEALAGAKSAQSKRKTELAGGLLTKKRNNDFADLGDERGSCGR